MESKHDRCKLLGTADLKERGWTDGLMKRHLPDPDDYRDNPHYKCASPMKFWLISTIKKIERRKSFQEDAARSLKRSVSAKMAAPKAKETRAKALQHDVESILPEALRDGLLFDTPSLKAVEIAVIEQLRDPHHRNLVNYLRHECTAYDYYSQFLYGAALDEYRGAVLDSIAKEYKRLACECAKQKDAWVQTRSEGQVAYKVARGKKLGLILA
ncbi:hypothetical protein [Pseudoruegeria sp. HB172150]|uniref:hypothetical protein n=1 Tax=Pseudoruegeria sp. HB172150 TaxID=2721164 RepID=UPI001552A503|nr:hypothetical protein [Pseudoruegeria sp. HB172150]